ncbi:MAG: protein arginine kinase [Candidatus Omnitrophica bacterium]|nr:protein arginine kinase [Candidatus Omnitrophota bacterium]
MFNKLLTNDDSWLSSDGPSCEIVFSSRIRLARNIAEYPFPKRASIFQRQEILDKIKSTYPQSAALKKSLFVAIDELNELDRYFLLERHLVSKEHIMAFNGGAQLKGRGLIISSDERIAIMINEEDHLRLQYITSGFDLARCWRALCEIDDQLNKKLSLAFLPELGFLTACPTNVGTALRASCMLHLPALVLTKKINKILELLAKIFFTARGFFGEGTQALGNFFQISNQVSLGVSEEEIVDNLTGVVNQIREQEVEARNFLLKKHKHSIEDNIWRALAMLQNSRLMNSSEALGHLSMLSLGLDLGIIKDIPRRLLNSLFVIIQPAHLQKIEGRLLETGERDWIRASVLREKLK